MALPNIFEAETTKDLIHRINQLTPMSQRRWGKMKMMCHINITYPLPQHL